MSHNGVWNGSSPCWEFSRSGYYLYVQAKPSHCAKSNQALLEKIKKVHRENRELNGIRRLQNSLKQEGVDFKRHRIFRLMKKKLIAAVIPKRYKVLTTKVNAVLRVAKN